MTTVEVKNYLNGNFKKNLLSQQNYLLELNEKLDTIQDIRQKPKIEPNFPDYFYEKNDLINPDSKGLKQYSIIYHNRLNQVKEKIIEGCKSKWPNTTICNNILGLKGAVSK